MKDSATQSGAFDPRRSWEDLLQPGKADRYFEYPGGTAPEFHWDSTSYDAVNAWWLAELSRLIYRHKGRDQFLRQVGLVEEHRVERSSTHCAVFAPASRSSSSWAIAVFEGTADLRDWFINLDVAPTPWHSGGRVHQGFAKALRNVWDEVEPWVSRPRPTFYAGHSLGGALAGLACSLRAPRAAYTFGAPRAGDARFARALANVPLYRIVLHRDVVPTVPPADVLRFRHAGELHYITGEGTMLVNPPPGQVELDQAGRQRDSAGWQQWLQPVEPLADHAPVRYVEALRALL